MSRVQIILSIVIISLSLKSTPIFANEDNAVAEQIRKLIPMATAMQKKDFEHLTTGAKLPDPKDFEDQSLTLQLFTISYQPQKQTKQFRWLNPDRIPKPAELAQELSRGVRVGQLRIPTSPITMIQSDRITNLTCKVENETAQGVVSFKVPYLYEGQVEYLARQNGKRWRITDLKMSDYRIHLVRSEGGLWEKASAKK